MKVLNNGQSIKVKAEFIEIATIVRALYEYSNLRDDDYIKKLADQLANPKINLRKGENLNERSYFK